MRIESGFNLVGLRWETVCKSSTKEYVADAMCSSGSV